MSEAVEVVVVCCGGESVSAMQDPSKSTPSSCRFHPSFFVCRRHDGPEEILPDPCILVDRRHYELGPDDPPYAAKFYDCCGAEDPDAPGSCYFAGVAKTLHQI